MPSIGSVISTPTGPARVVTTMPGAQEQGGQKVERVLTTPLTEQGTKTAQGKELSQAEEQKLKELKDTDRAVRIEERHHAAVAGAYGGTPQYQYVQGPDGKYYAVAGKVDVGVPQGASPEQAERAHKAIAAAATSVSTPSSADFNAAAQAGRLAAQAYGKADEKYKRGDYMDYSF
ncbi:MAG: putative metalloprotease CJM1_0395 family protein [Magnetospirillum sp.]